jgi:hypothetical protein
MASSEERGEPGYSRFCHSLFAPGVFGSVGGADGGPFLAQY